MATKTTDDIFGEYRAYLKGLKPTANVDQNDSDWWIRGRVWSGVLSGVYADIEKNAQDAFPQNARREAVLRWIFAYFNENSFTPATVAEGSVALTGSGTSPFTAGLQMTHAASGNVYSVTANGALVAGVGTATIQSVLAGQSQNLDPGTVLSISSPPAGINSTATVGAAGIIDGTNEEDEERGSARILARMRSSARGGSVADYTVWALSVAGVTSVSIVRYIAGLGTVGAIITSGTTDIDAALDANLSITFTAGADLIAATQAYLESVCPETDCPLVFSVDELAVNVTATVKFITGTKSTVLSGQTLTQGELVQREIKRAIYKTPTGGTRTSAASAQGYLLKKTIEDMIDSKLSAAGTVIGDTLQIVTDRIIADLDGVNANKSIGGSVRVIPGTITIVDG